MTSAFITTNKPLESSIYSGTVFHQRSIPKVHKFDYQIYLFWLKLSELDKLSEQVKGFSLEKSGISAVNFKRTDYLGSPDISLDDAVLSKMNELNAELNDAEVEPLTGDIFLLGQVRTFGLYFSPVNFYYLRDMQGSYTHMLAEVSNTPWNQRHHYLVDLKTQKDSQKVFHVSPFNPMNMQYKWNIQQPAENLRLHLSCYQKQKHFEAAINMTKKPLNTANLRSSLLSIPSMTIKTVAGIYWQAIKLFFKRVPIYTHS
jgi:DUF1365 family protein